MFRLNQTDIATNGAIVLEYKDYMLQNKSRQSHVTDQRSHWTRILKRNRITARHHVTNHQIQADQRI